MLAINDAILSRDYFDERFVEFERSAPLRHGAGQRFAVCMPETESWLALCLYLRQTGASVAPLHPSTPLLAAKRLAQRMRCSQLLFHDETNAVPIDCETQPGDSVLIQLSSGTSGEPKCIERKWASVDEEVANYVDALGELGSRTPLLACPVTHSYGLISGVLSALQRGVTPVVLTNINPKYVMLRADSAQHALLYASPTLLNVVVRLLGEGRKLCHVMTSGAPMRAGWFNELRLQSTSVLQQYGCSELGCISLNVDTQAATEVGTPLRHLRVTAGTASAPEEIKVAVGDRVVDTRDLGYFNERSLCFVSRLDDTINVAGINVYPREVEEVVLGFRELEDAVVYKRADPYAGERVCLKFTAQRSLDVAELRRFCVERLTPYAVPLEIEQVATIAKLDNGKINRRQLAETTDEARP